MFPKRKTRNTVITAVFLMLFVSSLYALDLDIVGNSEGFKLEYAETNVSENSVVLNVTNTTPLWFLLQKDIVETKNLNDVLVSEF